MKNGEKTVKRAGASSFGQKLTGVLSVSEWVAACLMIAFAFFVFYYTDFSDTLDNSVMLGESVVKGQFGHYYEYAAHHAHELTVYTANYNVFLYFVFLIWNLPTFIIHMINGFDYMTSLTALLWCKAIVVFAMGFAASAMRKIISLWVKDKRLIRILTLLFITSSCTVFPALVESQYDILSVALMLWGLYFYLNGRSVPFFVLFAIAVPLKMFALFIYIPLILLREKRIRFIAAELIPIFAINFLLSIPFHGDRWYEICIGSQNRDAVELIVNSSVKIGKLAFCPFLAGFLALCVFCFIRRPPGKEGPATGRYLLPVWVSAASMIMFVCLVEIRSYWVILAVPFILMLVSFDPRILTANILLSVAGTACYTVYALATHWVLSSETLANTLILRDRLKLPDGRMTDGGVRGFFLEKNLDVYAPVFITLFIASCIVLLVLNYPARGLVQRQAEGQYPVKLWFVSLQIMLCAFLLAFVFICASSSIQECISSGNGKDYSADVLTEGPLYTEFVSPDDRTVSVLSFRAKNNASKRYVRSTVEITVENADTGEELFSTFIGTVEVRNDRTFRLGIGELHLKEGTTYRITFSGCDLKNKNSESFRLECDENGSPVVRLW